MDGGWLAYLLVLNSIVYSWYYDRLRNPYLSRIFREDKYGIVIQYALLTAITLARFTRIMDLAAADMTKRFMMSKPDSLGAERWYTDQVDVSDIKRTVCVLSIVQAIVVNFIFSHHTGRPRNPGQQHQPGRNQTNGQVQQQEDLIDRQHERVHFIGVPVLGLLTFAKWCFSNSFESDTPVTVFSWHFIRMVVFCILYYHFGKQADQADGEAKRRFHFLPMLFEALTMAETLDPFYGTPIQPKIPHFCD